MRIVSIHELTTHLSRLLEAVALGEPGLVPLHADPREPGALKGKLRIGDDFDAPLPPGFLGVY